MKAPPYPTRPSRSRPDPLTKWAKKVTAWLKTLQEQAERIERENLTRAPAVAAAARKDAAQYETLRAEGLAALAAKRKV